MGTATWEDIKKEIEYINRHVEFERMLDGQDDEFEDEMRHLTQYIYRLAKPQNHSQVKISLL